jgi:formylglycine-generating enzyme required for sulfatase activity/tRNA A-37 threonylcarbamoyl transferase component Bud32
MDAEPTLPLFAKDMPAELRQQLAQLLCWNDAQDQREQRLLLLIEQYPEHAATLRAWSSASPVGKAGMPAWIGPYRVISLLGRGGFGEVYAAEQEVPLHRRVALKVLQAGLDSKVVLERFHREQEALARMNHDAVARIYDAGTTADGRPYIAMELVEGQPLVQYCNAVGLPLRERLELFVKVCHGVHHAHQKGVVHRDLKPSNVLVTQRDGQSQPKLIDFGVARAFLGDGWDASLTQTGMLLGTPAYMAPEQVMGDAAAIDTRTDVYGLGAVLYELLTGHAPRVLREHGKTPWDARQLILEGETPRPSQRQAEVGQTVPPWQRAMAHDLDWIVLKAMAYEPERRYSSVAELAADITRYLRHEPVLAGPPSAGYRLRKMVRRYRVQVTAGAVVLGALLVGAVTTFVQYLRAEERAVLAAAAQGEAVREKARADATVDEFEQLSGVVLYERVVEGERALCPPWPVRRAAMQAWLDEDCNPLLAMRPRLEQTVQRLRERQPGTAVQSSQSAQFLRQTLEDLLGKLATLAATEKVHVEQRLRWAVAIGAFADAHPGARHRWAAVRAAIAANAHYQGLTLDLAPEDMMGLVPIGENPVTKLWEFYDLRSAWDGVVDPASIVIPMHRPDGTIEVAADTGIVFVLLPGGEFLMGAQKAEPSEPNFDPGARSSETPHRVGLRPFLLARHELTQGQWLRLWQGRPDLAQPSQHKAGLTNHKGGLVTLNHPVEQVDYGMARALASSYGLRLPTEAQWEYACRAGTSTPWWCGEDAASLVGVGNVLDQSAARVAPTWGAPEAFDDHFVIHCPVGTLRANAFGMHEMHGNVWEWCLDRYDYYDVPTEAQHGERVGNGSATDRVTRGGGISLGASLARSALRMRYPETTRVFYLGVRMARALQPLPR